MLRVWDPFHAPKVRITLVNPYQAYTEKNAADRFCLLDQVRRQDHTCAAFHVSAQKERDMNTTELRKRAIRKCSARPALRSGIY